jgi:hypothetical protein
VTLHIALFAYNPLTGLVVRPTPIYAPVIEAAPKELSTLLVPKAKGDVSLQKFRCGRRRHHSLHAGHNNGAVARKT